MERDVTSDWSIKTLMYQSRKMVRHRIVHRNRGRIVRPSQPAIELLLMFLLVPKRVSFGLESARRYDPNHAKVGSKKQDCPASSLCK